MRRILPTIVLSLLAAGAITLATFLAVDGNLARVTGMYRFKPGMPLFSKERLSQLNEVCWMRIQDLHDTIVCAKDEHGTWWIIRPFKDRLAPEVADAIFAFTTQAKLVDTLPLNNTTRGNMREFGVETSPYHITLKRPQGNDSLTTVARYTLGSASPWLADAGDGKNLLPTTYLRTNFYGRDKRIHVVSGNILSLFKDGLGALRDPYPLRFEQDQLRKITISSDSAPELKLQRLSAESPWSITAPVIAETNDDNVHKLIMKLLGLKSIRVENDVEVKLPEKPAYTIKLEGEWGETPKELKIYDTFTQEGDDQKYCHATINDRPVVFSLLAEPRNLHTGSYASLIKAVCELPVLPGKALAQVRMAIKQSTVSEIPLKKEDLRSMLFASVDEDDVAQFSLRSVRGNGAIRALLIPGDEDSKVPDNWMVASASTPYEEAENATVMNFLKAFKGIPVEEIVADTAPGADMTPLLAEFGLNKPDYVLAIKPRPCLLRATLFGNDMPFLKDRNDRYFLIRRLADSETGKIKWYGTEMGSNCICRLSSKFARMLSLRVEKWKSRKLLNFNISAVRKLVLDYQQAPLELEYEYMGETWSGTLKGEDITPRINPHRAVFYLRRLQDLRVSQWLDADDEDALQALKNPAFRVRLDLEITDYSDAESTLIEQEENAGMITDTPEGMLKEQGADADILRSLATMTRKTHAETRTIEIAPASYDTDKPFFYGRLVETGQIFVLPYDTAQSLAGDILEM